MSATSADPAPAALIIGLDPQVPGFAGEDAAIEELLDAAAGKLTHDPATDDWCDARLRNAVERLNVIRYGYPGPRIAARLMEGGGQ